MNIRRKSAFSSSSQSSSCSFASPSSSSSSSIIASSLASSTDSSSSAPPNLSSNSADPKRCQGLDLLVKAIHLVTAGSVVGVPYIQRRVVQRRRRALKFNGLIACRLRPEETKGKVHVKTRSMLKRQSRMMRQPS